MNAQTIFKSISSLWGEPAPAKPVAKDFPPEAFSYDDPITAEAVARIQAEANKKLDNRDWVVIERIEDLHK